MLICGGEVPFQSSMAGTSTLLRKWGGKGREVRCYLPTTFVAKATVIEAELGSHGVSKQQSTSTASRQALEFPFTVLGSGEGAIGIGR